MGARGQRQNRLGLALAKMNYLICRRQRFREIWQISDINKQMMMAAVGLVVTSRGNGHIFGAKYYNKR